MMDESVNYRGGGWGGGFGGEWASILVLLALFGRGGFGGFGGEGSKGPDIERMMLMQGDNFNNRFNSLAGEIAHVETNGFNHGLMAEVGRLGFENAIIAKDAEISQLKCCCETNRNIDGVRNEMTHGFGAVINNADKNTCAIITNQTNLAKDAELREAYAVISKQNTELSEQRVIGTILQTLQPPRPIPAYAAANPYENFIAPVRVVAPQHNCGFNGFNNCGSSFA